MIENAHSRTFVLEQSKYHQEVSVVLLDLKLYKNNRHRRQILSTQRFEAKDGAEQPCGLGNLERSRRDIGNLGELIGFNLNLLNPSLCL